MTLAPNLNPRGFKKYTREIDPRARYVGIQETMECLVMPRTFLRQELYDLVWTKPMRSVAAEIGISDVALAKTCKHAGIPVPPRGYWAKKAANKALVKADLPLRFPGAVDRVEVGAGANRHWSSDWRREIADADIPPVPSFNESLEALSMRVHAMVGNVPCESDFSKAYGDIAKLLAHDEERRRSKWSFDKPRYESGLERRRLLILLSLFRKFQALGCRPSMRTSKYGVDDLQYRGVNVRIGAQHINFMLEAPTAKLGRGGGRASTEGKALRLSLGSSYSSAPPTRFWEDGSGKPLERRLGEIVEAILVEAERQHRAALHEHREWIIERKAQIREEEERRKAEAMQRARELHEKQENERIARLMRQAASLQKAETIRAYVATVRGRANELSVSEEDLNRWTAWALGQADRVDPVKSGIALEEIIACPEPLAGNHMVSRGDPRPR